jgi:hypothetical protein
MKNAVFNVILKWISAVGIDASVVLWSEFLSADPGVRGSIPGATRFSQWQWAWDGVHSAS